MTQVEEALALLGYADETLEYARFNYNGGLYRAAVSLAYFASFYAAQAVVAYHGEGPKTHRGVRVVFGRLVVVGSDFPGAAARLLASLAYDRINADYNLATMGEWDEPESSAAIEQSESFVAEVHAWFGRHYRPDQ